MKYNHLRLELKLLWQRDITALRCATGAPISIVTFPIDSSDCFVCKRLAALFPEPDDRLRCVEKYGRKWELVFRVLRFPVQVERKESKDGVKNSSPMNNQKIVATSASTGLYAARSREKAERRSVMRSLSVEAGNGHDLPVNNVRGLEDNDFEDGLTYEEAARKLGCDCC